MVLPLGVRGVGNAGNHAGRGVQDEGGAVTNLSAIFVSALIAVESGGDYLAVGKHGELGALQITEACIRDVNRIYGTTFKRIDAFNTGKAIRICELYLAHYASDKSDFDKARIWNGGPNGHRKTATIQYGKKVEKALWNNVSLNGSFLAQARP